MASTSPERTITFDVYGQMPGAGVPLREIGARSQNALSQIITGANDVVFSSGSLAHSTKRIHLNIVWPGYEHLPEWSRPIEVFTPMGPLTRVQLAMQITANFARFLEVRLFYLDDKC